MTSTFFVVFPCQQSPLLAVAPLYANQFAIYFNSSLDQSEASKVAFASPVVFGNFLEIAKSICTLFEAIIKKLLEITWLASHT